jgi:hypothetical protein
MSSAMSQGHWGHGYDLAEGLIFLVQRAGKIDPTNTLLADINRLQ